MAANTATHHTIGVRLTKPLYSRIAKRAAAEHRTVSNLVTLVLEQIFTDDAKPHLNGAHKTSKAKAEATA